MEKYSQQLSNFTTDDNWCHLLSSLRIPTSDVQHNSRKRLCPDVLSVPMCPHLPYLTCFANYTKLWRLYRKNKNISIQAS